MKGFFGISIVIATAVAGVLAAPAKPLVFDAYQRAAPINLQIRADLEKASLKPTGRIGDAAFVRRTYLGIIGRIPSAEETKSFLEDRSTRKRQVLIDQLVASQGFDSHLFNWLADLLRVQTRQEQFGLGWHVWLRQSLVENKPWNQLVSEMLKADGHCISDPAVGYYLRDRNMQLDNFSNTMQVFLGQQIGCAQCHDHPFESWTQYEYYQMAAFGGGIQYRSQDVQDMIGRVVQDVQGGNSDPVAKTVSNKEQIKEQQQAKQKATRDVTKNLRPLLNRVGNNAIVDSSNNKLHLPADYKYKDGKPGQVVEPETLFGPKVAAVSESERREAFANWVASPENPYFTRTIVNRLWQRTFGYPLLDSLDNLGAKSKTQHPEVLASLEATMKEVGYDMKKFLRILYQTELFQRECMDGEPAMGEALAFRGFVLNRMSAEQFNDSLLMLANGNVDDGPSADLAASWDHYVKMTTQLFKSKTNDLMVLAESAQQGEQQFRDAQSMVRRAQTAMAEAKDQAARTAAQEAMQVARDAVAESRQQANPLNAMQMQMEDKSRYDKKRASARASEIPSPLSLGSLMQTFGGSDRQSPSSGHTRATVPQALALLNNDKTDIYSSWKGDLQRNLMKLDAPQARLDLLFLTIYSDYPTDQEKQRFSPMAQDAKSLRDLTSAMLISNRFLFIP